MITLHVTLYLNPKLFYFIGDNLHKNFHQYTNTQVLEPHFILCHLSYTYFITQQRSKNTMI